MPSDAVQTAFTGLAGGSNLQQAFNFYRYIHSTCRLDSIAEPRILDFGGGWGRIARLFLRETSPDRIVVADVQGYAIHSLRETGGRFVAIQNRPEPPIPTLTGRFDLIYAYSVFSHLSQEYFHAWMDYLLGLLNPGGHLVFTTRGRFHINWLTNIDQHMNEQHEVLKSYFAELKAMAPPHQIKQRYENGEFQFYQAGGGGVLAPTFYGEAIIPCSYIEQHFRSTFVDFRDDIEEVNQSVVVLRSA